MLALRYVYVLALVLWLGGMVTLGGIAAPAIFQTLQARDPALGRMAAGAVFGEVLRRFQWWTYLSAGTMAVALAALAAIGPRPLGFRIRLAIVTAMLAISVFSGTWVSGRIERIRNEAGGPIEALNRDDPRRAEFGRLHGLSTVLMLVNIAGGLVLLYWEAQE